MNEALERFMEKWGFPTTLLLVILLFATGAFPSPLTDNKAMLEAHKSETEKLVNEVRKLVRLQSVMCTTLSKGTDCVMALTESPTGGLK